MKKSHPLTTFTHRFSIIALRTFVKSERIQRSKTEIVGKQRFTDIFNIVPKNCEKSVKMYQKNAQKCKMFQKGQRMSICQFFQKKHAQTRLFGSLTALVLATALGLGLGLGLGVALVLGVNCVTASFSSREEMWGCMAIFAPVEPCPPPKKDRTDS